jgi:hypothetical protein
MGDISVVIGESDPIECSQSIEVINVEMTQEIFSVALSTNSPISVTMEDAQPIQVSFESSVVNWDDIAGRPTYDSIYKCYVFREND